METTPAPTLAALVRERTGASWTRAKKLCTDGRVRVNGERCLDPAMRVAPGAILAVDEHGPRLEKGPLSRSAIVFHDRDLVVVDKPPGMLAVADTPGNKETLAEYARILLQRMGGRGAEPGLGVVHRIDRETSGLMVFARTAEAKRSLAARFRAHDIERTYHAIAHGEVPEEKIETDLVADRGDGLRGSHGRYRRARGDPPADAKRSVTYVRPIAALAGATLVECRLETGRQHQIRIHLSELGHPLVGERVYMRDYPGPAIDAPRTMLHARVLGFAHPRTGAAMRFEREAPEDFQETLRALSG